MRRERRLTVVLFLVGSALAAPAFLACSSGGPSSTAASAPVGSAGGTVEAEGVTLTVPPGALASDQTITITATDEPAPTGYVAASRLYHFSPDGVVFARPVEVRIALAGDPAGIVLVWSAAQGASGYEEIAVTAQDGALSGSVTHFSSGFLGRSTTTDPGPPGPPVTALDAGIVDGGEDSQDSGEDAPPPSCSVTCGDLASCCGNACVLLLTDPRNCGMCGKACGAGEGCNGGSCAAICKASGLSCDAGAQCCSNVCSTTGTCGAAVCKATGQSCDAGAQCCSASCTNGICYAGLPAGN